MHNGTRKQPVSVMPGISPQEWYLLTHENCCTGFHERLETELRALAPDTFDISGERMRDRALALSVNERLNFANAMHAGQYP